MPKSHSGEGIFFTSKSADTFILNSFRYQLIITAKGPNIKNIPIVKRGTKVIFEIDVNSGLHLTDVFKKYTNISVDSDYGFDKTEIRVKLFTMGGVHISRSQARRILFGLDKLPIIGRWIRADAERFLEEQNKKHGHGDGDQIRSNGI